MSMYLQVLVSTVIAFTPPLEPAVDGAVDPEVRQVLNAIKGCIRQPPEDLSNDALIEFWTERFECCRSEFKRRIPAGAKGDQTARACLRAFGKSDELDLALVMACPELLFLFSTDWKEWERMNVKDYVSRKQLMISVVKDQTDALLSDPKYLERYYRMVLWYGQPFGKGKSMGIATGLLLGSTREGLKEKNSEDYWWHGRNAVLCFRAFGKMDMLAHCTTDELPERFEKLYKFVKENEVALSPDLARLQWTVSKVIAPQNEKLGAFNTPSVPFNGMKGKVPDPTLIFLLMNR